ncbi:hypothetical protein [Rubricoccus marinus]|uniref:hypothetical protein n=1 Tax=Rubricoccus marinus TaxID=716817 RepID=UPI00117AA51C|nr:hypothetical protein [Rubricoccus marinus]
MKRWALAVALLASGCGGENAQQPAAPALPPAPPSIPDVGDLDDFDDAFEDADSLGTPEADSLEATALPDPGPSFAPFLTEFKVALQKGTARRLAAPGLSAQDFAAVAEDDAVRQHVLAAGVERYRREGTRREVYVVVGYDAEGNVVPEDEAITESAVGLTFDVVDGAYRLVRIERAG